VTSRRPTTSDKGVLRPRESTRHFDLRRYDVGPRLDAYVERYWSVRWDLRGGDPYRSEVIPHPCVNLSVESGVPGEVRHGHPMPGALLHGVETRRFTIDLSGYGRVLGVKFRPGGFGAFTGRDVGSLRDQVLPLREVFGDDADRVAEMVLDEDDDERRIAVMEAFLAPRIPEPSASYELVLEVVRTMFEDRAVTSVAEVTRRFGVSARTLQRLFRRYVGVGPKWVLRRYRIHDAAAAIDSGQAPDLAALSAELGWFDQAHFSHEFKDVLGVTPSEYAVQAADARVVARTP
jgi:AraC-like DNA-binding protein